MKSRSFQLFDEQGRPLAGKQGSKEDVLQQGLLHGASHVWLWRQNGNQLEVLLQRRAAQMRTFPGLLDISAAGHLDGAEDPLAAALRETREELGVELTADQLQLISIVRCKLSVGDTGLIENEFQWLYLAELTGNHLMTLEKEEVDDLFWKTSTQLQADIAQPATYRQYVPHGQAYFATLFEAIERVAHQNPLT